MVLRRKRPKRGILHVFNPWTELEFGECSQCGAEIKYTVRSSFSSWYPTVCPKCECEFKKIKAVK